VVGAPREPLKQGGTASLLQHYNMDNAYLRLRSGVQTRAGAMGPSSRRTPARFNSDLAVESCEAQMPGPELSPTQLEMLTILMQALCGYSGVRLNPTSRGVFVVATATVEPSGTLVVAMARQLLIYTCTLRLSGVSLGSCIEASRIAGKEAVVEGTCRVDKETNGAVKLMGRGGAEHTGRAEAVRGPEPDA
jgi:hypothetical protein